MHHLAVLSTGWAAFFHSAPYGVHHSPFLFALDRCIFIFLFGSWPFFLGPNLTHSYPTHLPTLISIVLILVPYLLYPIDIVTLITTIQTIYPTNLITLLITYPTNLTIVLTTYPVDLVTLHTQPPY
jgi:hypothetical protein